METPNADAVFAPILKPFVARCCLAGAVVAVADKERILRLEAVGYADLAKRKKMRPDALFWIASQTKPITAAALMMLVDEGKLGIEDPVEKYLPEFKELWLAAEQDADHVLLKRPGWAITIREILSHTSGMRFSSPMEQPTFDLLRLRDAVLGYAMTPLLSEPGTKYTYSNMGINTAGRIIEVVSRMAYEEFLDQRLFVPLGMVDTTFWPSKKQTARLAKTYKPNATNDGLEEAPLSQLRPPYFDRTRQPMPGGGLFSTVSDVARFCQMIFNGGAWEGRRYLSQNAIDQMTRKQTGETITEGYGLGWSTDGKTYGHGGALSTGMTIDSVAGLITVFHVQHAGFPGDGGNAHEAFRKAAVDRFAKAQP